MRTPDAEMFGSDTSEPEEPAVIGFSGTTSRVEESVSTRAESERSGLGTAEVDGLAGLACPEVMSGMGKTTPSEVVMVGLAATISDETNPLSPCDFDPRGDALSPIESEAPSPDCKTLAVGVVLCRGATVGAVAPIVNEPPDPNTNSLDRLTALVSPAVLVPTDAVACVDIVPDLESSDLDS